MVGKQVVHPPRETLVAFGSGKLDPTAAVAVEEHIAECQECCETLHGLGSDTFVDLLRESDDMQLDAIDGDSITGPLLDGSLDIDLWSDVELGKFGFLKYLKDF